MGYVRKLCLIVTTVTFVSGCLPPTEKYLEEASNHGIYQESIRDLLNQNASQSSSDSINSFDISGIYISEITSDHSWYFRPTDRDLLVRIKQIGNEIAAFDSTFNIKIEGKIENSVVHYYVFPSLPTAGNSVSGEWSINTDESTLLGKWRADSHSGGGKWNLRKLKHHGMELYTTKDGKDNYYEIDESEKLFDSLFNSDENRNIVFYLHGRGDGFEEEFDSSEIPFIEDYSNTRFVIVRWLSWAGTSPRPYKHAMASSLGLSELLFAFNDYKYRKPEIVGDKSVTLLAHSMGNIPIQGFLEHLYRERKLQNGLFNAIILSSADLSVNGHRAWLEKCDFADELFVIQHRRDLVLYLSEWFFGDHYEQNGLKLGTGFDIEPDISNLELAANAKYLDLTNLSLVNHKHFKDRETMQLFKLLLNGQGFEFPDPSIGLYRKAENQPIFYFDSGKTNLINDSVDHK